MEFRKSKLGYLKLGVIFTIFGIIPIFIMSLISGPALLAGFLIGDLAGFGMVFVALIVLAIFIQGWFVYWFYEKNKFRGKRK